MFIEADRSWTTMNERYSLISNRLNSTSRRNIIFWMPACWYNDAHIKYITSWKGEEKNPYTGPRCWLFEYEFCISYVYSITYIIKLKISNDGYYVVVRHYFSTVTHLLNGCNCIYNTVLYNTHSQHHHTDAKSARKKISNKNKCNYIYVLATYHLNLPDSRLPAEKKLVFFFHKDV